MRARYRPYALPVMYAFRLGPSAWVNCVNAVIERDLSVTPVLYYTGGYTEETLRVKPLRVGSSRHTLLVRLILVRHLSRLITSAHALSSGKRLFHGLL